MGGTRGVILFFMVQTSIVMGLKMKQDIYYATAEPNEAVNLMCSTEDFPDKCTFTR